MRFQTLIAASAVAGVQAGICCCTNHGISTSYMCGDFHYEYLVTPDRFVYKTFLSNDKCSGVADSESDWTARCDCASDDCNGYPTDESSCIAFGECEWSSAVSNVLALTFAATAVVAYVL